MQRRPGVVDDEASQARGDKREKTCWQCGRSFVTTMDVCPDDGARLIETELEDEGDPLIGEVFDGRFQIQSKLGEGGMGAVYSARRLDFQTDVALKLLKLDFARDDGIRKRFMYEARVISNLKHPHAVRLFDFGQAEDGHVYMVMELLNGESLADRLAYRFVSYGEAFDIITPICGVLGEAHIRDVIHRDLKPENIFLLGVEGNEEFPKLLDFGIAKHKREETMTKSGTLWGTPAYMSPEQAQGNSVGPAADIYAIGVMFYELISGNLPFQASTQMGFAVKHIKAPARPLSSIPGLDSVPQELDELVMAMLAKRVEDRPSSMKEVVDHLEAIRERHFDDALLSSIPAHEVDPIALQAWLKDAPDVSGELQAIADDEDTAKIDALAETAQADVVETEATETLGGTPGLLETAQMSGEQGAAVSDREIAKTLAMHGDGSEITGDSATEAKEVVDELQASPREEPGLDWRVTVGVAAGLVVVGLAGLWWWSGDEQAPMEEPVSATSETPVVDEVEDTLDDEEEAIERAAREIISSASSQAFSVILSAHTVSQRMSADPGQEDEEWEEGMDFLHGEGEEEAEGDDESRQRIREALEGTF